MSTPTISTSPRFARRPLASQPSELATEVSSNRGVGPTHSGLNTTLLVVQCRVAATSPSLPIVRQSNRKNSYYSSRHDIDYLAINPYHHQPTHSSGLTHTHLQKTV
jgi:hypothetical protein